MHLVAARDAPEGNGCPSDALENRSASRPYRTAIRGDGCRDPPRGKARRADIASVPDRSRSAIWQRPRRLEDDPRASNASCQIVGNARTLARRVTDENSGHISGGRVDAQNLQDRALVTSPDGGPDALGRRRNSGCNKKKQSGDDAVHALVLPVLTVLTLHYA